MNRIRSFLKKQTHLISNLNYQQKGLILVFLLAILISCLIRIALIKVVTPDFTDFLQPWMQHLSEKGLAGLGDDFSNYNTPYLILLWLASFLPFSDLVSVKIISIFFDAVLATGAFLVVRHFKPAGLAKYIAVLAVLFAPTVLQNGAMWGQCDVIYTSFIVFAFYAYLKGKLNLAWMIWGVAFAFKLQAIFFVPFLIFMTFYHRKAFLGPLYAAATVALLSCLPLFFGKTIFDVAGVYIGQTGSIRTDFGLAWFAPTAYQWVSNEYFENVKKAGVLFGAVVALGFMALAFVRKYNQKVILVIATASLLSIPFFLPLIHERYLFASEIFLIITALVVPRFIWAAIAMQIITTMAYITYFTQANQMPPIPFAELSVVVLIIIALLTKYVYRNSKSENLSFLSKIDRKV